MPVKFLQFSDVHLDSKMSSSRLNLPLEKQKVRNSELKSIVEKACTLALKREVDLVLVPGDLWDDENVTADTFFYTFEQFRRLGKIPVVIAPGNHDFYSPARSAYNLDAINRGRRETYEFPENVIIVKEKEFHLVPLPTLPDVHLVSIAFLQNIEISDRKLSLQIQKEDDKLNILLFHGSLAPSEYGFPLGKGQKETLPFTKQELLNQSFDYAAIGHYHHYAEIKDASGQIRGAYAGCPAGRSLDETGDKFVLIGEIEKGGVLPERLEKIRLDSRRIWKLDIDVTGLNHSDAVRQRVEAALQSCCANQNDIVYARFSGFYPPGQKIELNAESFNLFWFQPDYSEVEADYDIEKMLDDEAQQKQIAGLFVAEMTRKLDEAQQNNDEALVMKIKQARRYGLDALHGREVRPYEN